MTLSQTAARAWAVDPDQGCAPCAHLANASSPAPGRLAIGELAVPPTPEPARAVRWSGVIGMEGAMTGDGRLIERNALRWEELPLPLRLVTSDVGAHDGAVAVGRILSITRKHGGQILAEGDIDVSSVEGAEAARLIGGQIQDGVSMDLDDVSFEVRVAADLLPSSDGASPEATGVEVVDAQGRVTVLDVASDSEVMVTTSARVRAATLVAIPAFVQAHITLNDGDLAAASSATRGDETHAGELGKFDELVAGAGDAAAPPAAWFTDPQLGAPTPLTVTDDGRVFGHLALWDTCHVSFTAQGQCVNPPRSASGYAHYRLGSTRTREGVDVATGVITMNARHAGGSLGPAATLAHYEDTGLAAADVAVGEDAWGIWVAGATRPGLSAEVLRALRAAPLSGDWRRIGSGGLELVAALAVNTPGFPVPRISGLVASGQVLSLVASGMVTPSSIDQAAKSASTLSAQDTVTLARLARAEQARQRAAVEATAAQIRQQYAGTMHQRVAAATRTITMATTTTTRRS